MSDLAAAARAAILQDLEKIKAHHRRRTVEHRAAGAWEKADAEETLANSVRGCLVTAQAAVTRVLEPSAMRAPASASA